jgi:hypothetical protein
MQSFAYLSVLAVPLLLCVAVLSFLIFQIIRDHRNSGKKSRMGPLVFALVFWVLFGAFYLWRSLPNES